MTNKKLPLLFPLCLVFYEILTYLSIDMYLPSLPHLAKDLNLDQDMAQLTLFSWFLGSASMQLIMGPLSDRFGRKGILLCGGVLYSVACLICGWTDNMSLFLGARFIQGTTVSTVVVAGYSAIHESFTAKTAIKIIAIMGSVIIIAPALGPMLGAIILQFFNWRVIFYLLSVLSVVSLVLLAFIMPETLKTPKSLHLASIFKDYRSIIKNPQFLRNMLPYFFIFLALIVWIVESPFIIIETYEKSELFFGGVQLWVFGSFALGTMTTQKLINTHTSEAIIHKGLIVGAVSSFLFWGLSTYYVDHLFILLGILAMMVYGNAMAFSPLNRQAIDASPQPMGCKVAVFSFLMNIAGVLATYLVTLFNDKTINNIAVLMCMSILLGLWVFRGIKSSSVTIGD